MKDLGFSKFKYQRSKEEDDVSYTVIVENSSNEAQTEFCNNHLAEQPHLVADTWQNTKKTVVKKKANFWKPALYILLTVCSLLITVCVAVKVSQMKKQILQDGNCSLSEANRRMENAGYSGIVPASQVETSAAKTTVQKQLDAIAFLVNITGCYLANVETSFQQLSKRSDDTMTLVQEIQDVTVSLKMCYSQLQLLVEEIRRAMDALQNKMETELNHQLVNMSECIEALKKKSAEPNTERCATVQSKVTESQNTSDLEKQQTVRKNTESSLTVQKEATENLERETWMSVQTAERQQPPTITTVIPSKSPATAVSNEISVRLVGASSRNQGRVEVLYGGEWGTICDDNWDIKDADVICKMLGYKSAATVHLKAYFGQGNGPVWMDEVLCSGSEASIADCKFHGWGLSNCNHKEDAGVTCKL
ncbi:uncharacterized protein LOC122811043 isoform X2 [Protopterus annectens]|uniref:uncharacterized protein LOC122811043 isoform X2 n=1 Tax=Protopterus annectens TaxID=7888 RepID=UPI001CF97F73|nr:uncharacterized protein LOC122811043 isoform X2 [Protopterus annectens]